MQRTSIEAERKNRPKAATQRARVLEYIREQRGNGATDLEIQAALDMQGSTQRPRRGELIEQGRVVDSGATRKMPSGRNAIVWMAVEGGDDA